MCGRRPASDLTDVLTTITSITLVVIGVACIVYTTLGTPVKCWTPAQFMKSHVDFTDRRCSAITKYNSIYMYEGLRTLQESVTRWMPLFLIGLGVLAICPWILKTLCCRGAFSQTDSIINMLGKSGTDGSSLSNDCVVDLIGKSHMLPISSDAGEQPIMTHVSRQSSRMIPLKAVRLTHKITSFLFLFIQFILLNLLVTDNFTDDGFFNLFVNEPWLSERFPTEYLCNFKIRQLSNVHEYRVHCYLHINTLYQYVFVFFWFWYALAVFMSFVDVILAMLQMFVCPGTRSFVDRYMSGSIQGPNAEKYNSFVGQYIDHDIISELSRNESILSANKVCALLKTSWNTYTDSQTK